MASGMVAGDLIGVSSCSADEMSADCQRRPVVLLTAWPNKDLSTNSHSACLGLFSDDAPRPIRVTHSSPAAQFMCLLSATTKESLGSLESLEEGPLRSSIERNLHASSYGQILVQGTLRSLTFDGRLLQYQVAYPDSTKSEAHRSKDDPEDFTLRACLSSVFLELMDSGIVVTQINNSRLARLCSDVGVGESSCLSNTRTQTSHTYEHVTKVLDSCNTRSSNSIQAQTNDDTLVAADAFDCDLTMLKYSVSKLRICGDLAHDNVVHVDYTALSASTSLHVDCVFAVTSRLMECTPQTCMFVIDGRRILDDSKHQSGRQRCGEVLTSSCRMRYDVEFFFVPVGRRFDVDCVGLIPNFVQSSESLLLGHKSGCMFMLSTIVLGWQTGHSCSLYLSTPVKASLKSRSQVLHATRRAYLSVNRSMNTHSSVSDCRVIVRHSHRLVVERAIMRLKYQESRSALIYESLRPWQGVAGLAGLKALLRQMFHCKTCDMATLKQQSVLLYGPPGCSKTMLARALARETGRFFFAVHGGELLTRWLGESERSVRVMFDHARSLAPCVLFFDEIDAVTTIRSPSLRESSTVDRVLTQLMIELDHCHKSGGVTVVAATNRPDLVDTAVLRPGRMDRLLLCPPPDVASSEAILRYALLNTPLKFVRNREFMSTLASALSLQSFSGAQLMGVARHAALLAIQSNSAYVQESHVLAAADQLTASSSPSTLTFYQAWRQAAQVVGDDSTVLSRVSHCNEAAFLDAVVEARVES